MAAKEKKSGGDGTGSDNRSGGGRGGGRGRSCARGGGHGNEAERKTNRKFDKSKVKCYNCNEFGHFAAECPKPRKEKAHYVEKCQDEEPALLMIETCKLTQTVECGTGLMLLNEDNVKPEFGIGPRNTKSWYLDTGASNHMTGCEDVFVNIDKSVKGSVKFGDGSVVEIQGRGAVLIKAANEEHKVLTGVYFIPCLRNNIISLGQLDEAGCKTVLEDGILSIYDQEKKN